MGRRKRIIPTTEAVMEIVRKTTDMLYRYSLGRSNSGSPVSL